MASGRDGFTNVDFSIDDDLETIDTDLDLVRFDNVQRDYAHGQDICLSYTLGRECRPSARDWVGVYPIKWTSTKDYVTYEWSPKGVQDQERPLRRSIIFKAGALQLDPCEEKYFQFLYMTKHCQVVGVSSKFHISEPISIERPLGSFTSLTSLKSVDLATEQGSAQSFELVTNVSSTSFEYIDKHYSSSTNSLHMDLSFPRCLVSPSSSVSDLNLSLLFDITSSPLHRTQSSTSSLHLEWLFNEESQDDDATHDSERIYLNVLFDADSKSVYTPEEIFRKLSDICDGQWDDAFFEAVEESSFVEKSASSDNIVSTTCTDVIPYHVTDIVPCIEPGPVMLYQGPGPVVLYNPVYVTAPYASVQEKEEEKTTAMPEEVEEELLRPVSTRRFSTYQPDRLSDACQNKLNYEVLLSDLVRQLEESRPTPSVPAISMLYEPSCSMDVVPYVPKTRPQFGLSTPRPEFGKRTLRLKAMKRKCEKCPKKLTQLKRARKSRTAFKNRLNFLQKCLDETDNQLFIKTHVLDDMGRHVRQVSVENLQLRDITTTLREKLAGKDNEINEATNQKDWMDQSLQACQEERSELKLKCAGLKEEISEIKKEHTALIMDAQLEESRRTGRYLSTIASKERTIITLSTECNKLMEEISDDKHKKKDFENMYKASCDIAEELSLRIDKLQRNMVDQNLHTQELSKKLSSEKEKRTEVIRARDLEKKTRKAQVKSLKEALRAAEKLNKQAQKCNECKRTFSAGSLVQGCMNRADAEAVAEQLTTAATASQTCTVQTVNETSQTNTEPNLKLPTAPLLPLPTNPCVLPTMNCSSSVNCDPAIVAVGAVSSPNTAWPMPSPDVLPGVHMEAGRTSIPIPGFLTSSFDFLSGISKTFTNTLTEEFLPSTTLDFSEDSIWGAQTSAATDPTPVLEPSSNQVADNTGTTSLEEDDKCWADIVGEEEQEIPIVDNNWVRDFTASWKPKSGKRSNYRTPGRGVRFDSRDQPLDRQNPITRAPHGHGHGRLGHSRQRSAHGAGRKFSARKNMQI